jgi:hypothetical protein
VREKFSFAHIRPKDGEALADYYTRVIEWAIAEGAGRRGRIRHALHQIEREAHDNGRSEAERAASLRLESETAALRKQIAELNMLLGASVSKIDAEAERQRAAAGMRNRASALAEGEHGIPNELSVAIDNLSDPRPLWTETVRPA